MSINIWTDSMQHAALLGKPVLFTNWLIQRDIIPDGWYCYDLRGTHKSPSTRTTLVDHAADYHAGTVLSPIPLKHEGTASRRVNGTFYLLGEEMTLEQFCEEHDLAYPQDNREFVLRPASLDEVGLFYSEEKLDEALGTVGHLRMDFGHGEKEFWHTWWPHNEDRFNTPEFKEVLQRFVDDLRQTGLLKNLGAMDAYCWQHGGSITEDRRSYGYIAETENYRFCLRCTPFPGEYQGYLYLRQYELIFLAGKQSMGTDALGAGAGGDVFQIVILLGDLVIVVLQSASDELRCVGACRLGRIVLVFKHPTAEREVPQDLFHHLFLL